MDKWGAEGRSAALFSLVLDFPFLVAYSGLHAIVCREASDALREHGCESAADLRGMAIGSQIAAGGCDALENAAILGVLAGHENRLPRLARSFAVAKFALLAAGWIYAAAGLVSHLKSR